MQSPAAVYGVTVRVKLSLVPPPGLLDKERTMASMYPEHRRVWLALAAMTHASDNDAPPTPQDIAWWLRTPLCDIEQAITWLDRNGYLLCGRLFIWPPMTAVMAFTQQINAGRVVARVTELVAR